MKSLLILALFAVLVAPTVSLRAYTSAEPPRAGAAQEPSLMKPIKLEDFDGKSVNYEQFKNNVVLIDFWATWCGPCIKEIPALNLLHEKYSDKGLKVIAVTYASGDAKEVKPLVSRFQMKYPVFMGDDNQTYDLNIIGFPTTYLLTKDWKVYRKYLGISPNKPRQMEADIRSLLDLASE